ncbi:glycoside hydrolase family 26 protein [Streptomyces phaeochromogenes]|uniref:glycoside hydrolase family 26 protein n=1 Tax=Streptomyces phaeochromogenes TaxID=1923 RepID=UPI002DDC6A16|nr:glycosyl hydrolase [Streptomyces phaeochromogenes]WRZ32164.1 glycosyl hydrolase [Streptomyces phaeochromogenes]WSJ05504.1 glycosyl hydrolase [Streptomyces phaeochromogenes]
MAPLQRTRTRRLAYATAALTAGLVASAALASGPGYAVGAGVGDPPAPTPTAPTAVVAPVAPERPVAPAAPATVTPTTPASSTTPTVMPSKEPGGPAFGAYLDYGPRGVARISELSRWLGGADLRVAHTYLPGDRWSNIEGLPGFLDTWADWRADEDDRLFVLNVPMLERNEENVSDAEVRIELRRGAAGDFDHHFRKLAERLVDLDAPDTVIVLGWEMNGMTYTHRCGPDPEAWKKYWNRIVTTMRAVPGQKFRFDFAPNRGRDAIPWTQCYPGDDTVDIIGMDSYDQPRGQSFDEAVSEPYGLQAHVDFAKAHGKPISYPEWGLFRNGDNPTYMKRMLAWMDEHKPLYNTLTDYCPHGVWQCGDNPKASEIYRAALFGRTDTTPLPKPTDPASKPTAPTPVPKPTPPNPPNCSPLELGDWVEYWLGGKLCLRFDWWSRHR